ncbi:inactive protein kinase SELMODRAFT_444075-like isoform X5 [Durio zibethinus]|uniref:Inactive protein kinase SELMODRAFT_444075-like isoform X5 n=1 Tax=Durio zibethinus TaxID=66656 RepID=A0A6P5YWB6_DURZI|nr:inactive protein kinase SELMODRAFT_444075-like isoform X5 [Durio zibethinus]
MTTGAERVVVILDASKELSLSTIRWPLLGLSLKSGDKLIILGIIHQVNNPSMLSFMGAGKLMGFRTKLDPSSMFGTNKKITGEETERKKEQYQKNAEIEKISKQCKNEQIEFRVEMLAGSSLKVVASRAVRRFHATWLVLDRHMKNDERYFVENLSCNMVRIKKDNKVKKLRGPAGRDDRKPPAARKSIVTYAEMIPATSPSKVQPPRKFQSVQNSISVKERGGEGSGEQPWHGNRKSTSHSASTSSRASNRASTSGYNESKYSSSHFHDEEHTTTIALETGGELSPISINESGDQKDFYGPDENQKLHNHNDDWMGGNPGDQELKNSVCLTCNNRRPKLGSMREFSYAELQAATEGFNAKNFLSEGGFGSVYRGEINGMKIAVKQHKYNASLQGEKEFKSEVQLGDFGLARTQHEGSDQSSEAITRVVGTLGYLAPEYAECGKVSTKTDVYSFGVVLLQLITGMKTTDERLGGKSLVGWARPLLKDRNYPDLIDPRILESHDVHQLFWMVRVAEKCLSKDPRKRLTMDKVVYALNYIMDCDNSCCLRNFSPTQSDTVSRDSCESQAQPPIETTSVSSLSQFSERLPASLSISRKSSSSTLYDEPASSSGSGHERYL